MYRTELNLSSVTCASVCVALYIGPEVARAIGEFQHAMEPVHRDNTEEPLESKHHEENESWQKLFVKDVRSLTSSIEELGNPFE